MKFLVLIVACIISCGDDVIVEPDAKPDPVPTDGPKLCSASTPRNCDCTDAGVETCPVDASVD